MKWIFILGLSLFPSLAMAFGDTAIIRDQKLTLLQGNEIGIFLDETNKMTFDQVKPIQVFRSSSQSIPNIGVSSATIWLKFTIFNQTTKQELLINLKNSHLNYVTLYYPLDNYGNYSFYSAGNQVPLSKHQLNNQNDIFRIPIPPYTARTLYIKVASRGQIITPIFIGTGDDIIEAINYDNLIFGIYLGVILIMFFYNLFIYFTVNDKNYLYYIVYIFFIGLAQFILQGYGYLYFWNSWPVVTLQSINWIGALSGIATAVFLRVFLHTKENLPGFDKILQGIIVIYAITIVITLFGIYNVSYILIDIVAILGSFAFLWAGLWLALKGFRPAKFFLIAWSFFILSIIIYVIKDFGLIPYNDFTNNILLIGSSIEIALLSFALADKINNYKKEKEISQARALQASLEKEQFVKEQNVILETKILERTKKLQQINSELNTALNHLKETQSQLVDAEKMASLGQLTAGIAHEINNPINFVKSNIKPLQLDIEDLKSLIKQYEEINTLNLSEKLVSIKNYKDEIDFDYLINEIATLLKGIEDGATRTADIVKGLRVFSRVDESELKEADIHEGIDTTLMLLSNVIPKNISIIRNYADIPAIECYPGKLNQVFMNLLNNAVQAVKYKGDPAGTINITTLLEGHNVIIKIKDSGTGIPDSIKEKIFDPFFTTKGIGEGTGLGLSIVYSIIEKHEGSIEVVSVEGEGAEFIITLPTTQMKNKHYNTQELQPEDRPESA